MCQKPCLFLIFREVQGVLKNLQVFSPHVLLLLAITYVDTFPHPLGVMAVSLPIPLCEKFLFSFQLQF